MSRFNFLVSDVSIFSVYSPLQMLFFRPMYLQDFDIHCCRCSFLDQHICNLLFFELADTFQPACHNTIASTSCLFLDLRILLIEILHPQLALSITCRYIPQKLRIFNSIKSIIADTPHQNDISSTPKSHSLYTTGNISLSLQSTDHVYLSQ